MGEVTFSDYEIGLLRKLASRHGSEVSQAAARDLGIKRLSDAQRESFREAVLLEFASAGLKTDDEPTEYGAMLEALIDKLGRA